MNSRLSHRCEQYRDAFIRPLRKRGTVNPQTPDAQTINTTAASQGRRRSKS
jgi:hypothetical protein